MKQRRKNPVNVKRYESAKKNPHRTSILLYSNKDYDGKNNFELLTKVANGLKCSLSELINELAANFLNSININNLKQKSK